MPGAICRGVLLLTLSPCDVNSVAVWPPGNLGGVCVSYAVACQAGKQGFECCCLR
jgi:hypothetical protein